MLWHHQIYLFHITEVTIHLIAIKIEHEGVDLTTRKGYSWLQTNLLDESVNIYTSSKALSDDRNKDIFALIKQGANITKGELYKYFDNMVESK